MGISSSKSISNIINNHRSTQEFFNTRLSIKFKYYQYYSRLAKTGATSQWISGLVELFLFLKYS
jgi:hypothetical protein